MIAQNFKNLPAESKVARLLFSYGLCLKGDKIYCGRIKLADTAIAKACGVDRRAVSATIQTIQKNRELKEIFSRLLPTSYLKDVAPLMGWGVLEIVATDARLPGILAGVAGVIANSKISVRQAIVGHPELIEEEHLFIITEKPIPGKIIPNIRSVKGVKSVIIH
ncbi:MAG: amino acid-binding ACT domain protein [Candidatus Thermoplasmatota archaeon]|nr:amino acid-binding ACT domain protein [Candidatus Thermoplasmatota archaeon]